MKKRLVSIELLRIICMILIGITGSITPIVLIFTVAVMLAFWPYVMELAKITFVVTLGLLSVLFRKKR